MGHLFVRWSDSTTDNPKTIIATTDITKTAYFEINKYDINLSVDTFTHGTCTGGGTYPYATVVTLEAVPYSGHTFSHWSNGATYNPYTFVVTEDLQLTACFRAVGTPYQDTIYIHDTVRITDTLWLHDTIYIPQEGLNGVDAVKAKVYLSQGQIVVEGTDGNMVTLFDINGRALATKQDYGTAVRFTVPTSGTYMIRIGNHVERKVVVIR